MSFQGSRDLPDSFLFSFITTTKKPVRVCKLSVFVIRRKRIPPRTVGIEPTTETPLSSFGHSHRSGLRLGLSAENARRRTARIHTGEIHSIGSPPPHLFCVKSPILICQERKAKFPPFTLDKRWEGLSSFHNSRRKSQAGTGRDPAAPVNL